MANVCYSRDPDVELWLRKGTDADAAAFGLKLFRLGMKFSVLLTPFPAVLSWTVLGVRLALRRG